MSLSFPTNYVSSDYCPNCKMGWWLHGRPSWNTCDEKDPR